MDEAYLAPTSITEPDPQRSASVQLQFSARWQRLTTVPEVTKKNVSLLQQLIINKQHWQSFYHCQLCPKVHTLVLRLPKVSRSESFLPECNFLSCCCFLNLMQTVKAASNNT